MAILKHIYLIPLAIALTGCYENFTPDIETTPVLCINSLVTAGEPIEVSVSRTWLYNEQKQDVKDAEVKVYANDELTNQDYLPKEGDKIRIVATSPTYGKAEAEVIVPVSTPIKSVTWEPYLQSVWNNPDEEYELNAGITFNLNIEMEISDPASTTDYYQFSYDSFYNYRVDADNNDDDDFSASGPAPCYLTTGTFKYEAEPIFSEHIGVFESIMGGNASNFTFFTDRQFSGKTYTLHIRLENANYRVSSVYDPRLFDCGIELTLVSVSESYYNWANYVWQKNDGPMGDLIDIGLGNPMWGYSNVSTGAGVVAAQSKATYKLDLKDFIQQTLNSNKNTE